MKKPALKKPARDVHAGEPAASTGQVLWLVFAVLVTGLPHFLFVPPWIPGIVLCIAGWRILTAIRSWPLPGIWLRLPLTVLGFTGVLASYRQISGLDAGSALLLVMAAMKLLETRGPRDRAVMVFICYFLLFATFLRGQAIWSAGYLVIGVLVTTAALYQASRSGKVVSTRMALRMSMLIVLQAVPLMLVLFILFPRIPGPFWSLPPAGGKAVTGLANQMTPGDITRLARSDKVAFRVRFDATPPAQAELYWRGPVMNDFDGRTWLLQKINRRPAESLQAEDATHSFGYEVTLEPHNRYWLLALETPVAWDAPQAALSDALQLVNRTPVTRRMAYRGRSVIERSAPGSETPTSLEWARKLPAGRNPESLSFARDLRARMGGDRAYLNAILEHFRREPFYYTLTPPALGTDSVDDFLFGTRSGFCGHYASAFAVLARAAGIPARVVTGYQGAQRNPLGNYWIVRHSDAHAWVEVWLGSRWVRFDPTAAVAPDRIERGLDEAIDWDLETDRGLMRRNPVFARLRLTWDAANAGWNQWVLSFGPKTQQSLLMAAGIRQPTTQHLIVATALSITLFLIVVALWQRKYHRPRIDPLQRVYQRLCARAARTGRHRLPSEGPREYATALARLRPDLANEIKGLFGMYIRLRYEGAEDATLAEKFEYAVKKFSQRPAAVRP